MGAKRLSLGIVAVSCFCGWPPSADAVVCKYIDAQGNIVYSNVITTPGLKLLGCSGDASPDLMEVPSSTATSKAERDRPRAPRQPADRSFQDGLAAYNHHDYATALSIWRSLAVGGDTHAQFEIGSMYLNVHHSGIEAGEALKWLRLAAAQGDASAENDLGLMYMSNELGVPEDDVEGANWYRLSADQGYATAQRNLGYCYYAGVGVTQDYAEAAKWYHLAAVQGDHSAQIWLGTLYQDGQGVTQDLIRAYMWFNLADAPENDIDHANAITGQSAIAPLMKSSEIAEARQMARRCRQFGYKTCSAAEISYAATAKPVEGDSSSLGILRSQTYSTRSVQMHVENGIYVVSVRINDAITLPAVVDSGATDVSIPADVVLTLMRTGTIRRSDFLGSKTYVLADGSQVPSETFRIRSLRVGNIGLENVTGSVADVNGSLLLGQSFLARFKGWSIDNTTHSLVLH